jgi:hypothetical protein
MPPIPLLLLLMMKISRLIDLLNKAQESCGPDADVLLSYEEGIYDDGYSEQNTEGISDIRLINDWPLPGISVISQECEIKQKVLILYDNHFKLDSSIPE